MYVYAPNSAEIDDWIDIDRSVSGTCAVVFVSEYGLNEEGKPMTSDEMAAQYFAEKDSENS
jgi:hypothetical protein